MDSHLHIGQASDLADYRDRRLYRFLEILPGLLAWLTLLSIAILSFFVPIAMAIFIIVFDIYWLTKTIFLSFHMSATFRTMQSYLRRDWSAELADKQARDPVLENISWQDAYHLVILPMATEPLQVVRESIASLTHIQYPLDKLIVVLAIEQRVGNSAREIAASVESEFGHQFFRFLITEHPDGQEGELRGKGSNEAWAGREVKEKVIDPLGLEYSRIITSVFDIDTVVPAQFFACLTWHFLDAPHALRSSYQPVPIFTNNIWEAPAFARVFSFSTTFWQMIQQARPEQLVTFSSQSLSFQALVDIGFWQKNMVNEDSRIFWQCYLFYDADWRTIPLNFPVYMDANVAPTFLQTIKNQYKQIRRWHYGVENNPYFLFGFLKNKKIPLSAKWGHTFTMMEKTHSSATNALVIFLLGWLPIMIGRGNFSESILSYNLPEVTRVIMLIAMFGLVSSAIISIILLPPRPPNYGRYKWIWMILQWILFPMNFIFFGALPALDAQTRLMLGGRWRLGFWVTPKSRKEA